MKKLALFALMACAGASFAQAWIQPWTPPLPAFESRVNSCSDPRTPSFIALDDFSVNSSAPMMVTAINWWGTVSQPAQLNRPYYIAIYKDMNCRPDMNGLVFRTCVQPQAQQVGVDCKNQIVYRFLSNYPVGMINLPFGRYWLQISEADQQSVKVGAPDFWWSSHEPIVQCPAVQINNAGLIIQPLIEQCFGRRVDLAFEIL